MQYFPSEGRIDKMYFPYYGKKAHVSLYPPVQLSANILKVMNYWQMAVSSPIQENYVQPLVAVKLLLTKEDYNKELPVECRVEGSDIRNNDERDKFLGRVTFRIKVVE